MRSFISSFKNVLKEVNETQGKPTHEGESEAKADLSFQISLADPQANTADSKCVHPVPPKQADREKALKAAKRKTVESRPEEPGLEAIVVAPRRVIRFYKDKTADESERASHRGKVCEVKRSKKPLSQDNRNRLTCIVCVCVFGGGRRRRGWWGRGGQACDWLWDLIEHPG